MENNHNVEQEEPHARQHVPSAVVSGSGGDSGFSEDEEEDDRFKYGDPDDPRHADDLYDENMDEADAAYVEKHLMHRPEAAKKQTPPQVLLKPRNSDAVLSCPSCFQIVCMDCQRHERIPNQFRAMFVMGIAVMWDQKLIYDDGVQGLMPKPSALPNVVQPEEREEYYKVCCANCHTQVAALDTTEVYHFFGCLESA